MKELNLSAIKTKKLSLKAKILMIMLTLSIVSLSIFATISINIYKKDKISFVYDYLANETQAKSQLIASTLENYDSLIGTTITHLDQKNNYLNPSTMSYLRKKQNLIGLYVDIESHESLTKLTLIESKEYSKINWTWDQFRNQKEGLALLDIKDSIFIYKKKINNPEGFSIVLFKNTDLKSMLKSSPDNKNFLISNDIIITQNELTLENKTLVMLPGKIASTKSAFGLIEVNNNGHNFLVSFSKIKGSNLFAVSMVNQKKVLLVQDIFLKQVIIFLIFIASITLLIGVFSARWLTWNLDKLYQAAHELGQGNFDYKIEVTSSDEMGLLGNSFNSMGGQIKTLMDELKKYNEQLEHMVEQRTAELKHLSNIQTAMLNSLGQGFVLVDKENKIQPIYSKISTDMYEATPDQVTTKEIFDVPAEQANQFAELFSLTFNKMIEFNDVKPLIPEQRKNKKNQTIQFDYAPIKNDSGDLDYILIIGTDKTSELESQAKFEMQWNFSQMVTKIATSRIMLIKLINESFEMIENSIQAINFKKAYPIREIQRNVHTLKGNFSYFHVENVTKLAHQIESDLEPYFNEPTMPSDLKFKLMSNLKELKLKIEIFIEEYENIIQFKENDGSKIIKINELELFYRKIAVINPNLAREFKNHFYVTPIAPFFQMYPTLIHELGTKLNKNAKFVLNTNQDFLPDRNWAELFGQFIHFIRNSMDHGIEESSYRLEQGKPEWATISIDFEVNSEIELLTIKLQDDGAGIDWEKIARKDPSIKSEADAIERIKTGGLSSKDEVSDISGRGVGVSSLFDMVNKWRGKVEFINKKGSGLCIVLTIPLYERSKNIKLVA